jgi:homogentisate 1,2-dioxygenase (EC 1.13.11.5)
MEKAFEQTNQMTEEVAVMIDTRDPLDVSPEATEVEWSGYINSWSE